MPPTTETVAYGTASCVVALTTFPVTSRFCACTESAAQNDSNIAAYHEPLDIKPPGRAGNVGRPTLWLVRGYAIPLWRDAGRDALLRGCVHIVRETVALTYRRVRSVSMVGPRDRASREEAPDAGA